jgi:predicted nucleic acid-binding protein
MTEAVLDTNVVVQGLIGSKQSASAQTLRALVDNEFRLVASEDALLELATVLELPQLCARHGLSIDEIWALARDLAV